MKNLTPYLIELVFICMSIAAARFQAWWFDVKQRSIDHSVWAMIIVFMYAFISACLGNILLFIALICQRFIIFSPFLNYWRTPRRPFFYINLKGKSWLDRQLKKYYVPAYKVSLVCYIIIQLFL